MNGDRKIRVGGAIPCIPYLRRVAAGLRENPVATVVVADAGDVVVVKAGRERQYTKVSRRRRPAGRVAAGVLGNRGVTPNDMATFGIVVRRWGQASRTDDRGATGRETGAANRPVDASRRGDIVEFADRVFKWKNAGAQSN